MRINRLRSALKPVQDFSRASRQKTCPNGHKESEDCHSISVPLRCTPTERQSSSIHNSLSLELNKCGLETFVFFLRKSCGFRDFAYGQNLCVLYAKFPPPKAKRLQPVMPLSSPQGKNNRLCYRHLIVKVSALGP